MLREGVLLALTAGAIFAQTVPVNNAATPPETGAPSRANILRGEYGRYRANNDLLYYHLDIRLDPAKKFFSGKNTIRFKMLSDDSRIQLDLYANLNVDKILMGSETLKYERELNTVFVDFAQPLRSGRTYSIDFYYSGSPLEQGRFGGVTFRKTASGADWITPRAKARAPASGGRTRISGAMKWRAWTSASRSRTVWSTFRTARSRARRI